jgi:4-amino-4-deoxy-L-arabinose transferase-like glycosyltransferase
MIGVREVTATPWHRASHMAIAVLIGAIVLSNLIWCLSDRSLWAWDQSRYGYLSLDTWAARRDGLWAWLAVEFGAIHGAPPLIAWLGQFFVPFRHITGHFESALLLLNVVASAVTLWLVDATVRDLGSGLAGRSAAVLVCGGAGVFVALGHNFLTESLLCATAAFAIYVSLRADRMSSVRSNAAIIAVLSLSFLAKASSISFVVPLGCYIVISSFLARNTRRAGETRIDYVLIGIALLLAAATISWYISNWQFVVQHFKDATVGDIALNWGSPVAVSRKVPYWLDVLNKSLSPFVWLSCVLAALVVPALMIATIRDCQKGRSYHWINELWRTRSLFALVLGGSVVATILMFSLQVNEDPRFIIVTTPMIAVLIGWCLKVIPVTPIIARTLVVALLFNAGITQLFALGISPIHVVPFGYLVPVNRQSPPDVAYLKAVIAPTCISDDPSPKIIAVNYRNLNVNGAMFYSAQMNYGQGNGCKYHWLPFPSKGLYAAIDFISFVDPTFIVTVQATQQPPPDFVNELSRPLAEWIADNKNYERILLLQNGFSVYRHRKSPVGGVIR